MTQNNEFPYIIGCDCDPDRISFNNNIIAETLTWDGISKGIKNFIYKRKIFNEEHNIKFNMTWFVRSDLQIKHFHQNASYCLEKFNDIWQKLVIEGDEIAWHPHLWNLNSNDNEWYQDTNNDNFIIDCLSQGLEDFISVWGEMPKTVHAGWGFQNNTTMKFLSDSSIIADCSAMPGSISLSGKSDKFDWAQTPQEPYLPSKINYQKQSFNDADNLSILEVPCTLGKSRIAQLLKIFRDKLKRKTIFTSGTNFNLQVPLMTLLPIINNELLKSSISISFKNKTNYFLSYIHADELLNKKNQNGIHSKMYSMNSLFINVLTLNNIIKSKNYKPVSMNLYDYANRILTQNRLK